MYLRAGPHAAPFVPRVAQQAVQRGGSPLPAAVRARFEPVFGHDFGRVRVHADSAAADAARALDARAFTHGSDIVFGAGHYGPTSAAGSQLLAHELSHVVQQSARPPFVQRDANDPKKTAEDELADYIDQHPAWGTWRGGVGSPESFQEIEINAPGDESFYRSDEFRVWYFSGWRGLARFPNPTSALRLVAAGLIADATVRVQFLTEVGIGEGAGQFGQVSANLNKARQQGNVTQSVEAMEQANLANTIAQAEASGNYDLVDFDKLAKGREMVGARAGLQAIERFTIDGVEYSAQAASDLINKEKAALVADREGWHWVGVDKKAGTGTAPSGGSDTWVGGGTSRPQGKESFPLKALGGVYYARYPLPSGRVFKREFWFRIEPNADQDKGNRMLRLVWTNFRTGPLPADDPSAMEAYGQWSAGRSVMRGPVRTPGSRGDVDERAMWQLKGKLPKGQTTDPLPSKPAKAEKKGDAKPSKPNAPLVAAEPRVVLPDGKTLAPESYGGGFHGTDEPPSVVMRSGLPERGDDWRLLEHAEGRSKSALRGTTTVASDPVNEGGAAYWAGAGGYVYEIRGVPTWNVNKALEGRVPSGGGRFRGNLMHGENEYAIPARVAPANIKRWGVVKADARGRLYVDWQSGTPR